MKHKKDILFLCQFFYPEYVSSATLPFDTAVALRKAGFAVDALCGYPKEYAAGEPVPQKEQVEGVNIRRVKYIQTGRKGFLGRLINYFSFTFMVFLNLWRIAGYRAVMVYSNPPVLPWVAALAKTLFGTKLVFVAYDLYPEVAVNTGALRQGNLICRMMEHINRCVFRKADGVVALSSEMKEFIQSHREIPAEKIHVIPNWYQDQPREISREENPFRREDNRFTVSYFGNMGTAQDMQTILDAIRLLKEDRDCRFLFAGHGNKMEQLRQIVREENLDHVTVFDFLKGEDFLHALAATDCALVSLERGITGLCVPSKTYSYMMQGIPLLAVMDPCDIVSDIEAGAGMWVRNGESEVLAAHIRYLKENPQVHSRMREVCRELYLEKYTTEVCTQAYVQLLKEML